MAQYIFVCDLLTSKNSRCLMQARNLKYLKAVDFFDLVKKSIIS